MDQMGEELTDKMAELSVQQNRDMLEQQRYTEERDYERKQNLQDRRRQQQQDRIERSRYRYGRKREKRLDQFANQLAVRNDYLDADTQKQEDARDWAKLAHDMSDDQIDNQLQRESLNERRRSALQREKAARVRADKGDPKERQDYFYDVREDAFEAARSLRKAGSKSTLTGKEIPLPKAEAHRRLMAEYGQLLLGRGYPRRAVDQLIERALNAAGY